MWPVWAFSTCVSSSLSIGLHIILHLAVEFRPNRTIRDRVKTSYRFFKMAATASQFYFRFGFREFAHLGRSKSTCIPNLGETSAMLEFYFRFRLLSLLTIGMSFCTCLTNFVQIGLSATELWRHIHFSRWRPSATLNFLKGNCRPPKKCK